MIRFVIASFAIALASCTSATVEPSPSPDPIPSVGLLPTYDGPYCHLHCWFQAPGEESRFGDESEAQCSNSQCCKWFCYRTASQVPDDHTDDIE